jgi:2-dehydropantoate 2-reductase
MAMRIGIIGAGAIGSVVGGMLTRAGHDVTLIDQWPEHVEKMRKDGLRLSGTCGDHVVRVKALHIYEAQSITEPFDAVFTPSNRTIRSGRRRWASSTSRSRTG